MWFVLLSILFGLVCLLLVVIVLIQPAHSEGLASAFGGGGGEAVFGTKTITYASRVTIVLAVLFFLLAIVLNKIHRPAAGVMGTTPPAAEQEETDSPEEEPTED